MAIAGLRFAIDLVDLYRQSASYVDRILRGAEPADLPVQVPTKCETVLNLKTTAFGTLEATQELHLEKCNYYRRILASTVQNYIQPRPVIARSIQPLFARVRSAIVGWSTAARPHLLPRPSMIILDASARLSMPYRTAVVPEGVPLPTAECSKPSAVP